MNVKLKYVFRVRKKLYIEEIIIAIRRKNAQSLHRKNKNTGDGNKFMLDAAN